MNANERKFNFVGSTLVERCFFQDLPMHEQKAFD